MSYKERLKAAILAWLKTTGVTKSGLSRAATGTEHIVGLLLHDRPVSIRKCQQLESFIRNNPEGLPLSKMSRPVHKGATFHPDATRDTAAARITSAKESTDFPVPGLSEIHSSDPPLADWIRTQAMQRREPIVAFLAHLVKLGAAKYKENSDVNT